MRHRRQPKLYDQHLEYIDPIDCQSAIGFVLSKTCWGGFNAEVELMSCDKKINWQFSNSSQEDYKRALIKIDNALRILTAFRESYIKHTAAYRRLRKKK